MLGKLLKRVRIWNMKRFGTPARRVQGVGCFGQGLEDMYLLRIFGLGHRGCYVDVGSNDGIFVSNTYALYKLGWRGLCIEPNPEAFSKLVGNRPADAHVQAAVGAEPGDALLSWQEGVTEGGALGSVTGSSKECRVPIRTLDELLSTHQVPERFDVLSVDVEGFELAVLRSLDWSKYRPRIVIVEYNSEGRVSSEAMDYLVSQGYRPVLMNRWNVVFSSHWHEDIPKVHRNQTWFSLDRVGALR